jgi:hypothetical protein
MNKKINAAKFKNNKNHSFNSSSQIMKDNKNDIIPEDIKYNDSPVN